MRKILSIVGLLIFPALSFAGAIDVLPSIVKLNAGQTASSIQFRNTTDVEASFEIKVFEEVGVGAALQRIPTSDIVASPPIFSVKPGERQTVRFLIRKPNTGDTEVRYRLYAEQLPVAATPEEQGIRMLVNLGIPIFISPASEQVALRGTRAEQGMTIRNDGNVTVHLLGLEAPDCEPIKLNRYLRPTVSIDIRFANEQAKACAYQARLESGMVPLH